MGHPVNWFMISGPNPQTLSGFYKKIFGWKMSAMPAGGGMMVAKEEGGIDGGIGQSMDGQPRVPIYVGVADIDAHMKKIAKAGGAATMPKMELPAGMGFIAHFMDPDGNHVGLWQPGQVAAPPKAKAAAKPAPKAKAAAKKPAPKKAAKKGKR